MRSDAKDHRPASDWHQNWRLTSLAPAAWMFEAPIGRWRTVVSNADGPEGICTWPMRYASESSILLEPEALLVGTAEASRVPSAGEDG